MMRALETNKTKTAERILLFSQLNISRGWTGLTNTHDGRLEVTSSGK